MRRLHSNIVVLDRLGGFVFAFYILLVGSAAFAIVSAFSFALSVTHRHARATSAKRPPVTSDLLVPSASKISAGALAEGLDEAQGHFPSDQKPRVARRARVAGWVRHRALYHPRYCQREYEPHHSP